MLLGIGTRRGPEAAWTEPDQNGLPSAVTTSTRYASARVQFVSGDNESYDSGTGVSEQAISRSARSLQGNFGSFQTFAADGQKRPRRKGPGLRPKGPKPVSDCAKAMRNCEKNDRDGIAFFSGSRKAVETIRTNSSA